MKLWNILLAGDRFVRNALKNNPQYWKLTIENCLFRAVTLTKNTAIDKYKYSGYEIGFDRHGSF